MPRARTALVAALMLSVPALWAAPALAQQVPHGSVGSTGFSPPVHGGGAAAPRRPQEPPALPGAAARPGETARPVQTDLPPTEALFDAINRGDVTEARDAVGRGADIDGQNTLGMTPLDLSIDLSRNDITFLLLSMRNQDSGTRGPRELATQVKPGDKTSAKLVTARAARARAAQATVTARRSPVAAQTPTRYAGSGGAPNPQAGFLGFGASGQP